MRRVPQDRNELERSPLLRSKSGTTWNTISDDMAYRSFRHLFEKYSQRQKVSEKRPQR